MEEGQGLKQDSSKRVMNKSISKKNEEQIDKNKCLRKYNQYALEKTACGP